MTDDVKQVIVIRRDLKMRRGKEIAQGAHAAMEWLTDRMAKPDRREYAFNWHLTGLTDAEEEWLRGGHAKVTCQVDSEEELRAVHAAAVSAGLAAYLVTDAGRTEFHGEPTVTALAVGPDYASRIDPVTGSLRLY